MSAGLTSGVLDYAEQDTAGVPGEQQVVNGQKGDIASDDRDEPRKQLSGLLKLGIGIPAVILFVGSLLKVFQPLPLISISISQGPNFQSSLFEKPNNVEVIIFCESSDKGKVCELVNIVRLPSSDIPSVDAPDAIYSPEIQPKPIRSYRNKAELYEIRFSRRLFGGDIIYLESKLFEIFKQSDLFLLSANKKNAFPHKFECQLQRDAPPQWFCKENIDISKLIEHLLS